MKQKLTTLKGMGKIKRWLESDEIASVEGGSAMELINTIEAMLPFVECLSLTDHTKWQTSAKKLLKQMGADK